jgi:hypothetical protein
MIKEENMGIGGGWVYATYDFGNAYISKIGRVEIEIMRSMNTPGLCRIDTCVLFDDDGRKLFDDEDMAYAADYLGEDNLITCVARQYGIPEHCIEIVEPMY